MVRHHKCCFSGSCVFRGFISRRASHESATCLMSLAMLGQYTVPLARRNVMSRPRRALRSLLLMDALTLASRTGQNEITHLREYRACLLSILPTLTLSLSVG